MSPLKSKVIVYVTSFEDLNPLISAAQQGCVTHALISLFHLGYGNEQNKTSPYVHLNNYLPSDPVYSNLWEAVPSLKSQGVTVMASLGGGGVGDYRNLFTNYSTFYPLMKQALLQYNMQGLDLDIEERSVSTDDISMLIDDLRRDMPSEFVISSAPVASALTGGGSVSPGVNYGRLLPKFDWYNLQFYNGWGGLDGGSPDYTAVVEACGVDQASKLVAGVLTNPENGNGYAGLQTLVPILKKLKSGYPDFGGVDGWHWSNAFDMKGQVDPLCWAQAVSQAVQTKR